MLESLSDSSVLFGTAQATGGASASNRHHRYPSSANLPPVPSVLAEMVMSNNPYTFRAPLHAPPPYSVHGNNVQPLPAAVALPTANNQRQDLGPLEAKQTRLAVGVILASRSTLQQMDHFMRISERHIHTALSLMTISREVSLFY